MSFIYKHSILCFFLLLFAWLILFLYAAIWSIKYLPDFTGLIVVVGVVLTFVGSGIYGWLQAKYNEKTGIEAVETDRNKFIRTLFQSSARLRRKIIIGRVMYLSANQDIKDIRRNQGNKTSN